MSNLKKPHSEACNHSFTFIGHLLIDVRLYQVSFEYILDYTWVWFCVCLGTPKKTKLILDFPFDIFFLLPSMWNYRGWTGRDTTIVSIINGSPKIITPNPQKVWKPWVKWHRGIMIANKIRLLIADLDMEKLSWIIPMESMWSQWCCYHSLFVTLIKVPWRIFLGKKWLILALIFRLQNQGIPYDTVSDVNWWLWSQDHIMRQEIEKAPRLNLSSNSQKLHKKWPSNALIQWPKELPHVPPLKYYH